MESIIGEALIFVILDIIGGTIRWLIGSVWRIFTNRPKKRYKDYIFNKDEFEHFNDSPYGCLNIIVAIIFIIIVVLILI
ncbi:hypothetical protein BTO05_02645 [Winogradskyella sp. PC-19]|uniref:hypothetical protein n=1 Tax=unclassified Winogradskyella TaxID=2615021 RepID=UPI000B3CFE64|nr:MULTISPECIES: hypothetical protein [unclassified Winogradskyella]ARV08591.1 hypothetical protein BTO05_02645 [Winogradskyella sp. PC-19]